MYFSFFFQSKHISDRSNSSSKMSDIEEFSGGRVLEKLEAQIQAMELELAEVNANIEARKRYL